MTNKLIQRTFPLGRTVITRTALRKLHPEDTYLALGRHSRCVWGDCCPEDVEENELSLKDGFRLFSVFKDRNQV